MKVVTNPKVGGRGFLEIGMPPFMRQKVGLGVINLPLQKLFIQRGDYSHLKVEDLTANEPKLVENNVENVVQPMGLGQDIVHE